MRQISQQLLHTHLIAAGLIVCDLQLFERLRQTGRHIIDAVGEQTDLVISADADLMRKVQMGKPAGCFAEPDERIGQVAAEQPCRNDQENSEKGVNEVEHSVEVDLLLPGKKDLPCRDKIAERISHHLGLGINHVLNAVLGLNRTLRQLRQCLIERQAVQQARQHTLVQKKVCIIFPIRPEKRGLRR